MRTTLSIDDDALEAARKLAQARNQSLGQVVSELMRRGLSTRSTYTGANKDFPVFGVSEDSLPFALDDVKRDEDEPD
jgi:hypothetical protein